MRNATFWAIEDNGREAAETLEWTWKEFPCFQVRLVHVFEVLEMSHRMVRHDAKERCFWWGVWAMAYIAAETSL